MPTDTAVECFKSVSVHRNVITDVRLDGAFIRGLSVWVSVFVYKTNRCKNLYLSGQHLFGNVGNIGT